jgi:hypothetical protein
MVLPTHHGMASMVSMVKQPDTALTRLFFSCHGTAPILLFSRYDIYSMTFRLTIRSATVGLFANISNL